MAASRWNDRGFSFIELIVALAIFAASFVVLLAAHTSASRQEAHARRLFTASTLVRELLTETEIMGYPDPGDEKGDFGENFPDYSWTRRVTDADLTGMLTATLESMGVDPALAGVAIPPGLDNIRQVELTVSWAEHEKPFKVSMTYFAVPK